MISSPDVYALASWTMRNGYSTMTFAVWVLGPSNHRNSCEVGRLVTTQIAAGRGTERLIRFSARKLYRLVRQRSVPSSVVPHASTV